MMMDTFVDAEQFRAAMRRTASSVGVLATDGAFGRAGLTVSSLSSLSAEPPSVLCCVHRQSRALEVLLGNGVFTANFLATGQSKVADVFAGFVAEHRENRFAVGEWKTLFTGAPALSGTICSFDCRVAATFEFGTHRIIAGEVMALETGSDSPLVYSDRAYKQLVAG
ncbi:flavin reductase family protein [Azospirillum rugosum]|uniref:Flavin reductase (DIM6/NTAB) family NADH-FMN oxidoreductase RutF n=1 Tax=Azospirillum rugosum TaxID=416170 RepID=A0ABS4SL10_9PROT|nr:flavin reductase family protein [Azospirillum rugosum]MBP2293252.1 flavin reductase (DIM6/NTAB) family NADH-FMN oxidoreductase RutF [Azospirillum rugosum]